MPITPDTIDRETKDYLMRIYKAMGFRITPIEFLQLYCYAYNELERMGDPDPKTNAIQLMDSLDPSLTYSELRASLEEKLILREYPAAVEELEELEELRKRVKELEEQLAKSRAYEYLDELQEIKRQLRKISEDLRKIKQMRLPVERRYEERQIQRELKTLRDEIMALREELQAVARRPSPVPFPMMPSPEAMIGEFINTKMNDLRFILDRMYGRIPDYMLRELGTILDETYRIFEQLSQLGVGIMDMRIRTEQRGRLKDMYKKWNRLVDELYEQKYIRKDLRDLMKALYGQIYAELMRL